MSGLFDLRVVQAGMGLLPEYGRGLIGRGDYWKRGYKRRNGKG